jgi:hypothetical protein
LPTIIRILGESSPEIASLLDILSKEVRERNSKRNGKQPQRGRGAQDKEVEIAIIEALAPLQNKLHFGRFISTTNDYNQTLAHFAVHLGYLNLLERLVEWKIDLTIADVNGLTALHCAYKKGDRACVELLLENGAPETVLDALGQAPPHLMPEGFDSSYKHGTGTATDNQSPSNSTDMKNKASDDEAFVGDPELAYREGLDQIDTHILFASTSKAAASGSMSGGQYNGDVYSQEMRQTLDSSIVADVYSALPELWGRQTDPEAIGNPYQAEPWTIEGYLSGMRGPASDAEGVQWSKTPTLVQTELWPSRSPTLNSGGGRNGSDFNINVDENGNLVSFNKQIGPNRSCGTYTRRESKPYHRPTPPVMRKSRPVKYEDNIQRLQQRCRKQGADEGAIDLLGKVFANGVGLEVLMRPLTDAEVETNELGIVTGRVYTAFLEPTYEGEGATPRYICRLCHSDQAWKLAKDVARHLMRDHFGLGHTCRRWYVFDHL